MTKANLSTGNHIVDYVGQMNFTGNITPDIWYHTIVNQNNKANLLAIAILSDIVYWYRPIEQRDESGAIVSYVKKFDAEDFLQRSYEQLSERFGVSKGQAKDAILFLEELGIIKRIFRTVKASGGQSFYNVMFIELIPQKLFELTYPSGTDSQKTDCIKPENSPSPTDISTHPHGNIDTPLSEKEHTYTKNTTEITTKTSITTSADKALDDDVINEIKKIFPDLSTKDLSTLYSTANGDISRLYKAKEVLDSQKYRIYNVVGWLIKAIENDYQVSNHASIKPKDNTHNFEERKHDEAYWQDLELALLRA